MIWNLILCYVLVTQAVTLLIVGAAYFFSSGCEHVESLKAANQGIKLPLLLLAVTVLGAPFFFPFIIKSFFDAMRESKAESDYWNGVRREFKALSLEPLHPENVGQELRNHIDAQSECLNALGYQHLGEVWIKDTKPQMSKGSFWLSPDQSTMAEITSMFEGLCFCEVSSYLEDGTVVSTANCESSPVFSKIKKYGFFVSCHLGLEMDQLLIAHKEHLATVVEEVGQPVRPIEVEIWKEYCRFQNRRFAEVVQNFEKDVVVPDEIVFPSRSLYPIVSPSANTLNSIDQNV